MTAGEPTGAGIRPAGIQKQGHPRNPKQDHPRGRAYLGNSGPCRLGDHQRHGPGGVRPLQAGGARSCVCPGGPCDDECNGGGVHAPQAPPRQAHRRTAEPHAAPHDSLEDGPSRSRCSIYIEGHLSLVGPCHRLPTLALHLEHDARADRWGWLGLLPLRADVYAEQTLRAPAVRARQGDEGNGLACARGKPGATPNAVQARMV
jgi:hypothetical protein